MKRSIQLLSILAVLVMISGCVWNRYKASAPFNASASHITGTSISVATRNGGVEVLRDSTVNEVVISATITCTGETQAEADERLANAGISVGRDTDRTLHIEPRFPGGRQNGDGARFVVRLPDADGVTIDTSNGAVVVNGLTGKLTIDTSNGSVDISDHDGDAQVDTSNASIVLDGTTGTFHVDTSNGSIKVTDHLGPLYADTSNSSVNVQLHRDAEGPVELDTSNSSIRLTVGPAFGGRVVMDTSNGTVSMNGDQGNVRSASIRRSRGEVTIGEGDARSILDTSNGNVELTISSGS